MKKLIKEIGKIITKDIDSFDIVMNKKEWSTEGHSSFVEVYETVNDEEFSGELILEIPIQTKNQGLYIIESYKMAKESLEVFKKNGFKIIKTNFFGEMNFLLYKTIESSKISRNEFVRELNSCKTLFQRFENKVEVQYGNDEIQIIELINLRELIPKIIIFKEKTIF